MAVAVAVVGGTFVLGIAAIIALLCALAGCPLVRIALHGWLRERLSLSTATGTGLRAGAMLEGGVFVQPSTSEVITWSAQNDRRHVISAVGFLYPLDGVTLTFAGLFQSGQPVNLVPDARVFGTQDLNGDGASFGENFVGNSDRYPGRRGIQVACHGQHRLMWDCAMPCRLFPESWN